jgi:hypothetical protein
MVLKILQPDNYKKKRRNIWIKSSRREGIVGLGIPLQLGEEMG